MARPRKGGNAAEQGLRASMPRRWHGALTGSNPTPRLIERFAEREVGASPTRSRHCVRPGRRRAGSQTLPRDQAALEWDAKSREIIDGIASSRIDAAPAARPASGHM